MMPARGLFRSMITKIENAITSENITICSRLRVGRLHMLNPARIDAAIAARSLYAAIRDPLARESAGDTRVVDVSSFAEGAVHIERDIVYPSHIRLPVRWAIYVRETAYPIKGPALLTSSVEVAMPLAVRAKVLFTLR